MEQQVLEFDAVDTKRELLLGHVIAYIDLPARLIVMDSDWKFGGIA